MIIIQNNPVWCRAIFKLLLTQRDLIAKYNFRPKYFPKELSRLFEVMDDYMDRNPGTEYSQKLIEAAYFDRVRPELRDVYYADEQDKPVHGKDRVDMLNQTLCVISSLYISIEEAYSNLTTEFIEDRLDELVKQCSIFYKLEDYMTAYTQLSSECQTTDEYVNKMNDCFERAARDYQIPDVHTDVYMDIFDERLRVEIDDRTYPSMIYPLNEYLVGGFRKQAAYGFMTKTGGGKSTFLVTIASDAIRQGCNVCYVNLEMNDYEVSSNIMSALSEKHSYKEIIRNMKDDALWTDLKSEIGCYVNNHFSLINKSADRKCDMKWLRNKLKSVEQDLSKETGTDYKFDMVFVDYLNLMEPVKSMMRNSRSDEMYRQLAVEFHNMCQDEKYCGITVFQTNRGAESKIRAGERIGLDDISDSIKAINDLDGCFSIQRDTERDGILIGKCKVRQYDGVRDDLIFVPYNSFSRRYDSVESEFVETVSVTDSEGNTKRGRPKKEFDITVMDVLEAVPSLSSKIPLGTIVNACNSSDKVEKTTYDKMSNRFNELGWRIVTKDDFEKPDWAALKSEVMSAIEVALNKKHSKNLNIAEVKISGEELFK